MKTPERESEELNNGLRIFQKNLQEAAERPDAFWMHQRDGIMAKLQRPVLVPKWRPALLWAPAAMMVGLCLFFFVESGKAPTPDFATGYDQRLLIEVEQALNQESAWALAPAALITKEIEQALEGGSEEDVSKLFMERAFSP
jgi:hypothetical protein